jgi:sulfite reductase alpha subunit-like flavoprotein
MCSMLSDYDIIIIYGSESGNAEDLAFKLCNDGKARNFKCCAVNALQFPVELFPFLNYVVLIVSTTGKLCLNVI